MAWIEQTGKNSWRVRYLRDDGTYGSESGFHTKKAAEDYAQDMDTDRRRGTWLDPAGAKKPLADWATIWIETLDVEPRTEENYRRYLRRQILPRWGTTALGDITSLAVTEWWKELRRRYAASTIASIRTVFSTMLDDAVDERLIPTNPVRRHRRRGRRRDHAPTTAERVWAMPEHVIRIAEQATMRGGPSAGLLVITAAWTGCRWGELAGLQRDHLDLDRGVLTIDPDTGALHESASRLWLGPPKTPASARTVTLPPFLITLLRDYLAVAPGSFVFTSPLGCRLRRSTFDRRVFRPSVDGDARHGLDPVRPGLTFHGLRHSHKTWLIADDILEIAQAKRLGHHLANRLVEVYSHVAPEIETRLLRGLEQRWHQAHQPQIQQKRRPTDNRPHRRPTTAPHTAPAQRTTRRRTTRKSRPQLPTTQRRGRAQIQEANVLPNSSISVHRDGHQSHRVPIIDRIRKALRPGNPPRSKGIDQLWS
ncbi:tyrosine-type recombinase/integrase [Actinosynnema sp. ALI-1.44]|uniref:tyrosine-type recombinase/integrase n=1 Tax=Actinosynnema sp. ALI-1.44 TaxID=1933779 RepID=UPI0009FC8A2E|nr:site-specific integrase [Actinosynnema sp. ALI-1.44]